MRPALALLEFDRIVDGIRAGDAMVKRSPLQTLRTGTVHPGRYLVLAAGEVADVEEGLEAAHEVSPAPAPRAKIFLPAVHPDIVEALTGRRWPEAVDVDSQEALGVVETVTVPAILGAVDAALKGAEVELLELRLADGLGGKGYALFAGSVTDVRAAIEIASERTPSGQLIATDVIAQLHPEMRAELAAGATFASRVSARLRGPNGEET